VFDSVGSFKKTGYKVVASEVVEPASKVDGVAEEVEKEGDRVWRPTHDISATHHQCRHCSIACRRTYRGTSSGTHLL